MGVPGLLPALKDVARPAHVSAFAGSAVAVDAYCWLHKGSYSCARELCEGVHTVAYVHYCMDRVETMLRAGVRPVIVFDGGRLPAKAAEEASRHRNRADALARARAHAAAGNEAAALDCYRRAVDISPALAMRFAAALKARGVPFLVAPYEADAQMAYLARRGDVAAVVTEDSDLLPYGCPAVFFKMDRGGHGVLVRAADFHASRSLPLAGFDTAMLQETCALAGCDFVVGLPGIGVRTAAAHMKRHRSAARVLRALRLGGRTAVPPGFEAAHARAVWTFRHQRVFCPTDRRVVHVTPLPPGGLAMPDGSVLGGGGDSGGEEGDGGGDGRGDDALAFLGPPLPAGLAAAIAEGRVDPITHEPFPAEVLSGGARPPAGRPPTHQGGGGRFSFAPAGRAAAAAAATTAAAARLARPLPVAANGVAALFARHAASNGGAGGGAFVPPRRATVAGGEGGLPGTASPSHPYSRVTPAERAALHGPGGWGSQPPDGWLGRHRAGAGGGGGASAGGSQQGPRPLALSGPAVVGGEAEVAAEAADKEEEEEEPVPLDSLPPSPAALERALAEERAPFAACFAAVAAAAAAQAGGEGEAEGGATSPAEQQPAAATAAPPADGPRWGATPTGWRDFYATSPAGGNENAAPRPGGGGGGGRRSAHFAGGASGATPPPKRPAFGGGGGAASPPPGPVPFGGLGHVAVATAAAAAVTVGWPGGKKKKKKEGGGGGPPPLSPPPTSGRAPFAQFAFGN